MTKYLLIILLLTSCASDHRSAQVKAVKHLSKSYDLSQVRHDIVIIKLSRKMPAFFDETSKKIYLCGECDNVILVEEIAHLYLDRLGIPSKDHHDIMRKVGLKPGY